VSSHYDAVVIGSGHQGLIAAVVLAQAGWGVQVIEVNDEPGGALRSGEITLPGYQHDLYATNLNLFLSSPFYRRFAEELGHQGLRLRRSEYPYANVFPGDRSLGVTSAPRGIMTGLDGGQPGDARGWEEMYALYRRISPLLFGVYSSPAPSLQLVRTLAAGARHLGRRGMAEVLRLILSSCRELVDDFLDSDEAKALVACWGLHLDFGPDVAGGALFPFLEAMGDMEGGMTVAEGGASRVTEAICGLLRTYGGSLRTGIAVRRVLLEGGQAVGVELEGGEHVMARRAVIANVAPTALSGELLEAGALGPRASWALDHYRYGPATMMVHLALSGPVPWSAGDHLQRFAYVHVAPYIDDLARTYSDALAGRLPDEPLLVVGQTSAIDPTRAPGSGQVLWIQVRALPAQIREDPRGGLGGMSWSKAREEVADRVMVKLERYASGLSDVVLRRVVLSPDDLESHDRNLVHGDSISGSMHLRQNFVFRPALGMARSRMPIPGLELVGAGVWPGAGLNGLSGYHAAEDLLGRDGVPAKWLHHRRRTRG